MKKLTALVLVLLLLLAFAGCGDNQNDDATKSLAPDLFVYDESGSQMRLSQLKGKPVVLNFWASWCEPCKAEMSGFQEAYEKYGDQIHFMMVNMTDGEQETMETARGYIDDQGYTFPVYYDSSSLAAIFYGIQSIPATFFIDAEGYMVTYANTMISAEQLQMGIDMILPQD